MVRTATLALCLGLMSGARSLSAQTFTEVARSPFEQLRFGAATFADVDGDGDLDLLTTGANAKNAPRTNLYLNDGRGGYTPSPVRYFANVQGGSQAFGDIDGDGDLDLVMVGYGEVNSPTLLYTNDGRGAFTQDRRSSLPQDASGKVHLADLDGDGDLDLLFDNHLYNDEVNIDLFANDGSGKFTKVDERLVTRFGSNFGELVDIDNDRDLDLVVIGYTRDGGGGLLYENVGGFKFSPRATTVFDSTRGGQLVSGDFDGDGDADLVISGHPDDSSWLFINDGRGGFSRAKSASFAADRTSNFLRALDVDDDGDLDVLTATATYFVGAKYHLYVNDGKGSFAEQTLDIAPIVEALFAAGDVDMDGDTDLYSSGTDIPGQQTLSTSLYINVGEGEYVEADKVPFADLSAPTAAFADIDGDGDPDLLLSLFGAFAEYTGLYTNERNGNFDVVRQSTFRNAFADAVAFADVDLDGDLDLYMIGLAVSTLFRNDGRGAFAVADSLTFATVAGGRVAFADVNGDTYPDLLLAGSTGFTFGVPGATRLYLNDRTGGFVEASGSGLPDIQDAALAFGDVDGDGDQDLMFTGQTNKGVPSSELHLNDGRGGFTESAAQPFIPVYGGMLGLIDVDGDQDLDVLIAGLDEQSKETTTLYMNDGKGRFSKVATPDLIPLSRGSMAFADIDNDGDQDLLMTGRQVFEPEIRNLSVLYSNDGQGRFTPLTAAALPGVGEGSGLFADVDGDGDQDILISGTDRRGMFFSSRITRLYLNDGKASFTPSPAKLPELQFSVYPNPVSAESVTVEVPAGSAAELTVSDVAGRTLSRVPVPASDQARKVDVPVGRLAAGNYLVQVLSRLAVGQRLLTVQR